ncbi:tripartite tricarboxylate transporter substrate-binding protein [Piscinibacter sp.]|uniref:tripartite tricarboxylate transporter substrate-binding protein n=1 Tax=Piscinibacter sp. TaxID=1903157 RepID=UPI002CE55AB0|nr:tripartite tricarboxylate transporter substrate-binding protein [Albitalea sp.]HUG20997.1 tripartite tricarboxylate transporter substrate-binding protein [Albitalea sp.]
MESLFGLVAPKNLDPATGARLHVAFAKASTNPDYLRALDEFDVYPNVMAADDYFAYAKAQFGREKTLLAESGFKAE